MKILPLALLIAGLAGCLKEKVEPVPAVQGEAAFTVSVPGMQTPSTRALDANKEKQLTAIDVVIFSNTDNKIVEHHRIDASDIGGGTGGNDYQFRVKGIENTANVTLAVIANAPTEVAAAVGSGTSKTDFLSALKVSESLKWNTLPVGYRTIPMYGEITVTGNIYDAVTNTVNLTRMLAKVDVLNNVAPAVPASPADGDFELTAVHVVNRNTAGLIAPKWNATTGAPEPPPASTANLPAGFDPQTAVWVDGNQLTYTLSTGHASLENEIYLFESSALSDNPATPNGLRLVFEGNYTSGGVTKRYYYPVDFTTPTGAYMPVLRNHRYLFTITEAAGRGYDGLGEAVAAFGVMSNFRTSLVVVDESGIRHIVWNGEHFLGVSQDVFEFTREVWTSADEDNKLKIRTDFPNGWTAAAWNNLAGDVAVVLDGTTGNPWLRISPASGDGTNTPANEMTLEMDANESGAERTAYIHIKAGRLIYIVKVTQNIVAVKTITVSPSSVSLFSAADSWSEGIEVDCSHGDLVWTASIDNTIDFELVNAFGSPITGTQTGNETIYVKAKTENTSTTNVRTTTVTISSSTGAAITGSPVAVTQGKTLPDGGEPPYNITSYVGAFWKASQTGERLIRIPVGTDAANLGAWSVKVYWMDDNWEPGDIVFSTDPTNDPNVSFTAVKTAADMNNAANDALYSVAGNSTYISGTVAANESIYFRIGLKSKFSDLPMYSATPDGVTTFPARYAIVALSYNDNSKVQLLYLRQGHDPDVLGGPTIAQGNCVKWSPYNVSLTVGQFVAFPTMAGGMKNWDPTTTMYNPVASMGARTYTGASIANVCPSTYSIPTCNATYLSTNLSGATWNGGNQMGTLFHGTNIASATTSNLSNPLWGYYADGYFDRHWIRNSNTGTVGAAVNPTFTSVAYIGALVVHGNRSLFFPAAGYIERYYLDQREQGNFAQMWTSLGNASMGPWRVELRKTMVATGIDYVRWKAGGETPPASWPTTIRCVKP